MNKRQAKKRKTIIDRRVSKLNQYVIMWARGSGKTHFQRRVISALLSKKHKPFKDLIKYMDSRVGGVV